MTELFPHHVPPQISPPESGPEDTSKYQHHDPAIYHFASKIPPPYYVLNSPSNSAEKKTAPHKKAWKNTRTNKEELLFLKRAILPTDSYEQKKLANDKGSKLEAPLKRELKNQN